MGKIASVLELAEDGQEYLTRKELQHRGRLGVPSLPTPLLEAGEQVVGRGQALRGLLLGEALGCGLALCNHVE